MDIIMILACLLNRNYNPSQVIVTLIEQAYHYRG